MIPETDVSKEHGRTERHTFLVYAPTAQLPPVDDRRIKVHRRNRNIISARATKHLKSEHGDRVCLRQLVTPTATYNPGVDGNIRPAVCRGIGHGGGS